MYYFSKFFLKPIIVSESHPWNYWVEYYKALGIELVAIPPFHKPRVDAGYFTRKSYQAYQYLVSRQFDLIHFPDWEGLGYYSIAAKHDGLAFQNTIMSVGLHGPWRWAISANAEGHEGCLSEP